MRTGRCSGLQGLKRRSLGQLVHLVPLSQAVVLAARPIPLLHGFRTRNTVYSVFKVPREARRYAPFTKRTKKAVFSKWNGVEKNCSQIVYNRFLCLTQTGVYGLGGYSFHISYLFNAETTDVT